MSGETEVNNNRPEEKEKLMGRQEQKGHSKTGGWTRQRARGPARSGEENGGGREKEKADGAERRQTSKEPEEHLESVQKVGRESFKKGESRQRGEEKEGARKPRENQRGRGRERSVYIKNLI